MDLEVLNRDFASLLSQVLVKSYNNFFHPFLIFLIILDFLFEFGQLRYAFRIQLFQVGVLSKPLERFPDFLALLSIKFCAKLHSYLSELLIVGLDLSVKDVHCSIEPLHLLVEGHTCFTYFLIYS